MTYHVCMNTNTSFLFDTLYCWTDCTSISCLAHPRYPPCRPQCFSNEMYIDLTYTPARFHLPSQHTVPHDVHPFSGFPFVILFCVCWQRLAVCLDRRAWCVPYTFANGLGCHSWNENRPYCIIRLMAWRVWKMEKSEIRLRIMENG